MPELTLPLPLVRNGQKPLYRQLYEQLRAAILGGELPPGVRLPSSRALAEELGISRNSVVAVYEELLSEGYLVSQHGSGTSVNRELPPLPQREKAVERKIPRWLTQEEPVVSEEEFPRPVLASLDDLSRVVYIGSFSKVLTPALRAGYLIAPAVLRERITRLKLLSDIHLSWPLQQGLALFLQTRQLERYIQRLRHHYAEKRATLLQALAPVADLVQIQGLDAGLHVCLELRRDDVHEAEIVARSYQLCSRWNVSMAFFIQ